MPDKEELFLIKSLYDNYSSNIREPDEKDEPVVVEELLLEKAYSQL